HSKGGNLSLYVALTMKKELQDYLVKVVSFNAPGITKPILSLYEQRAKDPEFLEKLLIFENENDCVSAFFENLKEPVYVRSCYPCTNMEAVSQPRLCDGFSGQCLCYGGRKRLCRSSSIISSMISL
ncbi:MAG: Mbeg1-like protein, partial [Clostridium sp.]